MPVKKLNNFLFHQGRQLGVSFLEVLLILSISAGLVVMSVKYYQVAMINREVNSALSMVNAVISAADGLSVVSGSYNDLSTDALGSILKKQGMRTPWNTSIEVVSAYDNSYTIRFPDIEARRCILLKSKLESNQHIDMMDTECPTEGATDFIYTYRKQTD